MIIFLLLLVISILVGVLAIYLSETNYDFYFLGTLLGALSFVCAICLAAACASLIGIKGDNQEMFLQKQQDYIVLTQYIESNKSDSILESNEMLNKVQDYNKYVIQKQNDMDRPIKKYWAEGANWKELQLIDLESIMNETEE